MNDRRIRSQVDMPGGSSVAVVFDPPPLTDEQQMLADEIIERHIQLAIDATGLSRQEVLELWCVEVTLRQADAEAYQREAARRGVLAL